MAIVDDDSDDIRDEDNDTTNLMNTFWYILYFQGKQSMDGIDF
jgi:hypothetical protein